LDGELWGPAATKTSPAGVKSQAAMNLPRIYQFSLRHLVLLAVIAGVTRANPGDAPLGPPIEPGLPGEVALFTKPMTWRLGRHWLRGILKRPFVQLTPLQQETVLATYLDEEGALEAWEIRNEKARRVIAVSGSGTQLTNSHFSPRVSMRGGQPVVVRIGERSPSPQHSGRRASIGVELLRLNLGTGEAQPMATLDLRVEPRLFFSERDVEAALSIDDERPSFLLVAHYLQIYRTKWGLPVPDPQVYDKVATSILEGNTNSAFARVELPGRFWVDRAAFSVARPQLIECAWVRCRGRDADALCYSSLGPANRWSQPRIVASGRGRWAEFTDVSIARSQNAALVMWCWNEDGIYVAEVEASLKPMIHKLASWEGYDSQRREGIGLLEDAPSIDIYAVPNGQVYAIWAMNKRLGRYPDGDTRHRIQIACRVNGRWQAASTISEGPGIVRSPTIMVDAAGSAHIAFLRQCEKESFGCFYRRVSISPAAAHP